MASENLAKANLMSPNIKCIAALLQSEQTVFIEGKIHTAD